jgi:tetratricopeptide (TPR) repeat protein
MDLFRKLRLRRELDRLAKRSKEQAYEAFDAGDLDAAAVAFAELAQLRPDSAGFAYMQGLVAKYRGDWPLSLSENLRSIGLRREPDEASHWNAGIAATALGDWAEARKQWLACGIEIPPGEGPIDYSTATACLRLNPWGHGETLFATRIDPARAYIDNVPLPVSGFRFRDLVINDGAATGERSSNGESVPVFNVLGRLEPSDFVTYAVFVSAPSLADAEALKLVQAPGLGLVEDWTTVSHYCLRCSYGAIHRDHEQANPDWNPERNFGIAAQSRVVVDHLLSNWEAEGEGRVVESVMACDEPMPQRQLAGKWWQGPD